MYHLKELQKRSNGLVIPRTSALTVYAATKLAYELPLVAARQEDAVSFYITSLHGATVESVNDLAKKIMIDVDICIDLVKQIHLIRVAALNNPISFFMDTVHIEKLIAINSSTEEGAIFCFWEVLQTNRHLINGWLNDDISKVYASVVHQKLVDLCMENYSQSFSGQSPVITRTVHGVFQRCAELMTKAFNSLLNMTSLQGHSSSKVLEYMYESLFKEQGLEGITTTAERLAAVWHNKRIELSDNYSTESLDSELEIDKAFDEVDSIYDELSRWKEEGVTRTDVQRLNHMTGEIVMSLESNADLDWEEATPVTGLDMEGLFSAIGNALKKVVMKLLRLLEDILNAIARQFLRPFNIEMRLTFTDASEAKESWGSVFNSGLHDFIEEAPVCTTRPEAFTEVIQVLAGHAEGLVEILSDLSKETARSYPKEDNANMTKVNGVAAHQLEAIYAALAQVPLESGLFSSIVELEGKLEEFKPERFRSSGHPLTLITRYIKTKVQLLQRNTVKDRVPGKNAVKMLLTVAEEERFFKQERPIEKAIKDIASARKDISRQQVFVESVRKPPYDFARYSAGTLAAEANRNRANVLYSAGVELLSAIVGASGAYLSVYGKIRLVTGEMNLAAKAIDKL